MKRSSIIVCMCVSMFLVGCATKQTVVCVAPTGTFEPETGQELFEEINKQFPFTVKPREFSCKVKYDRIIGWALIPDKQKDALNERLESSKTLQLLQVQALNEKVKAVIDDTWKTAPAVSIKK